MLPSRAPVSVVANAVAFPEPDPGLFRLWLYYFDTKRLMIESVDQEKPGSRIMWAREGFKPEDFNDPWEPYAFTNDIDSAIVAERPVIVKDWPVIGTATVVIHEFGGHVLKHGDAWTDNGEHHKPFWSRQQDGGRCNLSGCCGSAGHSLRLHPEAHVGGGMTMQEAKTFLDAARRAGLHFEGYRLAYWDIDASRVPHAQKP